MSTRNGPTARGNADESGRRTGAAGSGHGLRYSRTEYAKVVALQEEVSRAEHDYQRLRTAYLEINSHEPGNELGLAMIGADMDRAHARLQALIGLPRLPFTHEPSSVLRRELQLRAGEKR